MGALVIRKAEAGDAAAVSALAVSAFGPFTAAIGPPPAPIGVDFQAAIAADRVWVAADADAGGAPLGYAIAYPDPDRGDALHLDSVGVDPAAQGRGVGRALIAACEAAAARAGFAAVTLYTNEAMEGALALYPRLGYGERRRGEEAGFRRVYFEKTLAAE